MKQEFTAKIKAVRQRGEAATDISGIFSVSWELPEISEKEIPEFIWNHVFPDQKKS